MDASRTGGQILADTLRRHFVDMIFCVPGESFLGALDALFDKREFIRIITCRHEAGAANMAEAYGKLTGRPGVAFVSRGPGACHASIAVHTAFQDSTPMVLFVGQVDRAHLGREAFQEIDIEQTFAPLAKDTALIDDINDITAVVHDAFIDAQSGRRGPVVIGLPEDLLLERAVVDDVDPVALTHQFPTDDEMASLRSLLTRASHPLVIAGGSDWSRQTCAHLQTFAETNHLPVVTSFRCKDRFDNTHPCYAGDMGIAIDPELKRIVTDADTILAIGARLGDMTTSGYTLLAPPKPKQTLIHIHPDSHELGKVYEPTLGITADVAPAVKKLAEMTPIIDPHWPEWTAAAHADYETFTSPVHAPGEVDLAAIFSTIADHIPAETIFTNGAGTYTAWHHRFYLHRHYGTYVGPTSGAMGYGIPAAIAAKLVHPDRPVIAMAGDGCFMMSVNELATARQYHAPVIVLVMDNAMYGSIRMHQERAYPHRDIATDLVNPGFAALARAMGGAGETVRTTEEFWPALDRALHAKTFTVIHMHVDPEAIMPHTTLSKVQEGD